MNEAILIRKQTSDQGTFGIFSVLGFQCFIGELPWRNNVRNISCIPVGDYKVLLRESPKYGITYWISNVPNRSFILQHSGNWCGNVEKGYKTHTNGCQLFGKYMGELQGQKAVLLSRATLKKFMAVMVGEPYLLKIRKEF